MYYILAALMMLVIASCEHELEKEDFIGPETVAASNGFALVGDTIEFSSRTPAFATDSLTAMATFSERVTWFLEVTGLESGAIYETSNTSSELNEALVFWDGGSDNNRIFKRNESIQVSFSVVGGVFTYVDTLTIETTKVYDGYLVSDFDGAGASVGWTKFSDPDTDFAGTSSEDGAAQGDSYYLITGEDRDVDFNVGGTTSDSVYTGLGSDPDEVYLNMYIRGIPNSRLDIRSVENDGDEYTYRQLITWEGWRLVSLKYSQLTLSAGPGLGQDPSDMMEMKFLLKSSPAGNPAESGIDFVIITEGKEFEP